jgi:hypothetical protein
MVAGCGGSIDATTPTKPAPGTSSSSASTQTAAAATQRGSAVDACTLITEQDATTAIGTDPGPGTAQASADGTSCEYLVHTDGRGVTVGVIPDSNRAHYDSARATYQHTYTVQDVSGIGDAAFEFIGGQVTGGSAAVILIIKGSELLTIQLSAPASALSTDTLTTLGHAAAGRL